MEDLNTQVSTGVEAGAESAQAPAAGEQVPEAQTQVPFGSPESQGGQVDERAFAARLAAERDKIRREYEEYYTNLLSQRSQPAQPQNELEVWAEQMGYTPEQAALVASMWHQVEQLRTDGELASLKAKYPNADTGQVLKFREQYAREHGGAQLPIEDAYHLMLVKTGALRREIEQQALKSVLGREGKGTEPASPSPAVSTDLSKMSREDFEKLIQRVKAGETVRL